MSSFQNTLEIRKRYLIQQISIVFLVLTAIVLSACSPVTLGRDFPVDGISSIQIGTTTQTEIQKIFGKPWRTGIEDGMLTWSYGYFSYDLSGKGLGRDLILKFNESGIVRSYSFNSTEKKETLEPESQ